MLKNENLSDVKLILTYVLPEGFKGLATNKPKMIHIDIRNILNTVEYKHKEILLHEIDHIKHFSKYNINIKEFHNDDFHKEFDILFNKYDLLNNQNY